MPSLLSIDATQQALKAQGYIADRALATVIFLALELGRPLFLEGVPGTGKTEAAKALASLLGTKLIRLQCHEGMDLHHAAYEWNYARQILHLRWNETQHRAAPEEELFSPAFLLRRPLLEALETPADQPVPVLLIDEIDRSDDEFEAFLLEVLSDFQITIPELGTIRAARPPVVILTSNRTREVHDALKRRCLYHWIEFPDLENETAIVRSKLPEAAPLLATQAIAFVRKLRDADLEKPPGVAETLDWTAALSALRATELSPATVDETLGVLLKYQDDIVQVRKKIPELLGK
jgi:MoxR-like ATPase